MREGRVKAADEGFSGIHKTGQSGCLTAKGRTGEGADSIVGSGRNNCRGQEVGLVDSGCAASVQTFGEAGSSWWFAAVDTAPYDSRRQG